MRSDIFVANVDTAIKARMSCALLFAVHYNVANIRRSTALYFLQIFGSYVYADRCCCSVRLSTLLRSCSRVALP